MENVNTMNQVGIARGICNSQIVKMRERLKELTEDSQKINYRASQEGGRIKDLSNKVNTKPNTPTLSSNPARHTATAEPRMRKLKTRWPHPEP